MICLDTNVLVRYLVQDDDVQSPIASRAIEALTSEVPGYIPIVVLVETMWVLTRAYRAPREQIAHAIESLLRTRELIVEKADIAYLALATYQATAADFSDALIAHGAKLAGCTETITFDEAAASATGMRLLSA